MEIFLELLRQGQSYWLDSLSREMVRGGDLERRVREQGLRGVTSNPAIFHKAISSGSGYDEQVAELSHAGASVEEIYESLVVTDIREACDVLEPVYRESEGVDGYVSLEVSPHLVHDTRGSLAEARHLWAAVDRPNLMIKIPGTAAGVPAIEELLYEGVNVNVTLLFAVEAYEGVARAYLRALQRRASEGKPLESVASVASFFLSRIDVLVDQLLSHRVPAPEGEPAAEALYGEAAVASARLAYRGYKEISSTPEWQALAAEGARPQRLLWASTSTKNPLYDPIRYVEPLVGRDTVNTMPEVTIEAFAAAGRVIPDAVEQNVAGAESVFTDLAAVGIDMRAVNEQLLSEGAQKFIVPFDALMAGLAEKSSAMRAELVPRMWEPEEAAPGLGQALSALGEQRFAARLAARDPGLWPAEEEGREAIANRLGWTRGSGEIDRVLGDLETFSEEIRSEGVADVVLLGMGGSSLCPLVAADSFPAADGFPRLTVLDSVDPAAVSALDQRIDPMRTLFLVASKSGGTVETLTLYRYFRGVLDAEDVPAAGRHFVAITDPGSPLAERAEEAGFRRTFEAPADVGGRYSALTVFGLLPMALMGADLEKISSSVRQMEHVCSPGLPERTNPAVRLGTALALYAKAGRDKLTLSATPSVDRFPLWIEQLVAESTGKEGRGIVPVTHEGLPSAEECSPDRVFVHYSLAGDRDPSAAALDALEAAGHPVFRIELPRSEDLGGEFLRWEIATAAAAVILGVNPFDEPDVSTAKRATAELLEARSAGGFPTSEVQAVEAGVEILAPGSEAVPDTATASAALASWLQDGADDAYVAVLGYFDATQERDDLLVRLRDALRARTGRATTFGVGPRYLHSTGQLHKGGPDKGLFLVLTYDAAEDRDVPDSEFSLGTLLQAQALGDVRTLRERGRSVLHAHLGWRVEDGLSTLAKLLGDVA